ncbi:MAG TPA: DUF2332 domain-containing protein [Nocardioides sp.]|nr:DUF2332 domain-containing protein [Nocardioides sp.]
MLLFAETAEEYDDFAGYCEGDSPTFADWARGVAGDEEVLDWLATLPPIKRQPNLVFAAARFHGVPAPGPYAELRSALLADDGAIRSTIMTRATQTNEVGRLATLLPALGTIPGQLALVEAGASAGLCLYPERWSYAWHTDSGVTRLGDGPELVCRVDGPAPLPRTLPEIGWRAGIDLHPLDAADADQMAWLTTLVWPEQDDRRSRLRQAIAIAALDPPRIVAGDLMAELPTMVEEASAYGTVVVFHSAVIAYLEPARRLEFDALMRGLVADGRCRWISNEAPKVLPSITATGPDRPEAPHTFVLGIDGEAVAHAHGHGAALHWL